MRNKDLKKGSDMAGLTLHHSSSESSITVIRSPALRRELVEVQMKKTKSGATLTYEQEMATKTDKSDER